MIDKNTGEIKFPHWERGLSSRVTREEFLKSPLVQGAKIQVKNGPHCAWKIPAVQWNEKWWTIIAWFNNQCLESVTLAACDTPDGSDCKGLSEQRALKLRVLHDAILYKTIGGPPYDFVWGKVESSYDAKSGGSYIVITYRREDGM